MAQTPEDQQPDRLHILGMTERPRLSCPYCPGAREERASDDGQDDAAHQRRRADSTRSGVIGMWCMRTPVARAMALAIAAAGGTIGTSPAPRTP
jgi:hypothetical protein